jgi:hypothetical protein
MNKEVKIIDVSKLQKPKMKFSKTVITTELQITVQTANDIAEGAVHGYLRKLAGLKNMPYVPVTAVHVFSYAGTITFRTEIDKTMTESKTEEWITNWLIPELTNAAKESLANSTITLKQTRVLKVKGDTAERNDMTKRTVTEYSAKIPDTSFSFI